jgi:hypothetical protein
MCKRSMLTLKPLITFSCFVVDYLTKTRLCRVIFFNCGCRYYELHPLRKLFLLIIIRKGGRVVEQVPVIGQVVGFVKCLYPLNKQCFKNSDLVL